ncbi:MAG: hypothetical protein RI886_650 [Pseudomonadota bacterium]
MKIFPAIDIKDGTCVRLTQGNFESVTKYNHDPLSQARLFLQHGFLNLHIVDLNGAKDGQRKNISQLNEILLLSQLSIQFGGGVRTLNEIRNLLKLGVNRVVVGTSAVTNFEFTETILKSIDINSITFALDFKVIDGSPLLASHGWQQLSQINLFDFIETFKPRNVLATDIDKDGLLQGPSTCVYKDIKSFFPAINLIGSGGISSIADIKALGDIGIEEVIVGKAIYDKKITLEELATC